MDSTKFDRLARVLGDASSRRNVLKGLAGVLVGGAALTTVDSAEAKVKPGKSCKGKQNKCVQNASCKNSGGGDKICKCDSGYRKCGNKCVDQRTDNKHCGRCDNKCAKHRTCVQGSCKKHGLCAMPGQNCNDTPCCAGFACVAGNDAFRTCARA
ncbi:MAG: hypothetical protein IT337_13475 [Thermomicrobiales bacterium]|nr:hypothetical protein [Thermomicrobiales bacterium]